MLCSLLCNLWPAVQGTISLCLCFYLNLKALLSIQVANNLFGNFIDSILCFLPQFYSTLISDKVGCVATGYNRILHKTFIRTWPWSVSTRFSPDAQRPIRS